jgi:large subunit ribosomal protein LP0
MSGGDSTSRKEKYFEKLKSYLDKYQKIVVVGADNVGSNQMQKIRQTLRGQAEVLMGKNTMVRKVLRDVAESNPKVEALTPLVKYNVGFVFTNADLNEIERKLLANRVGAPAKPGTIAPDDVFVPKGPTGMEPTQTSFLQALNIASKINKGQVEIVSDVHLIKKGEKVGSSEATLLQKLNIKPFSYGLALLHIYDNGSVYDPSVLKLTDADILDKFRKGVANVASLSLSIGYPTLASIPHSLSDAYKRVLAIAVETEYTFPAAQKVKDFIANPSAFAVAAPTPAAAAAPAAAPAKDDKKKVVVEEEEKKVEDDDDDMFGGGGLFGDD